MKPNLRADILGGTINPFADTWGGAISVGVMYNHRRGWIPPVEVYQLGMNLDVWCCSRWETVPEDALWRARGHKEAFYTSVVGGNLDWRNTPLEHRYNLSITNGSSSELEILAYNEDMMWGDGNTFIPFKEAHPQGYQGVLVSFDVWSRSNVTTLRVIDRFSPTHLLELR